MYASAKPPAQGRTGIETFHTQLLQLLVHQNFQVVPVDDYTLRNDWKEGQRWSFYTCKGLFLEEIEFVLQQRKQSQLGVMGSVQGNLHVLANVILLCLCYLYGTN